MNWNGHCKLLKKILLAAGLATALLAPAHRAFAQSAEWDKWDPRWLEQLPPYCKYTEGWRTRVKSGNDVEKIKEWYSIFGGSYPNHGLFVTMHHYCEGLLDVIYAKIARNARDRRYYWTQSIQEYDFMIRASEQWGPLMLPEFHTKKGETMMALGKTHEAVAEFQRAIQIKPDYWPPYAEMSDYFRKVGNIKMAQEILEQGLVAAPDTKALKRRLAELDTAKDTRKAAAESPKKQAPPTPAAAENAPQPETPQSPAAR